MKSLIMTPANAEAAHCDIKTNTRRPFKVQPPIDCGDVYGPECYAFTVIDMGGEECSGYDIFGVYLDGVDWGLKCPFVPGEIVYIRETWAAIHSSCHIDYNTTQRLQQEVLVRSVLLQICNHFKINPESFEGMKVGEVCLLAIHSGMIILRFSELSITALNTVIR